MVIVDTSVWSAFLRRRIEPSAEVVDEFKNLVGKNQVLLLGIVKQELLQAPRRHGVDLPVNAHGEHHSSMESRMREIRMSGLMRGSNGKGIACNRHPLFSTLP